VPSALRLQTYWQFLARVAYAPQVFFVGACPFTFLRRAMRPATASDPVLPHLLPEGNDLPPAEAVLFALRRIEAAFDAQSVSRSSKPCIPFPSARHNRYRLLSVAETLVKLCRIKTFSKHNDAPQSLASHGGLGSPSEMSQLRSSASSLNISEKTTEISPETSFKNARESEKGSTLGSHQGIPQKPSVNGGFDYWAKAVADELFRETRKETRAPKEAPILKRLTGLVRKIVSDHDGEWTTLPSLESIAKTFSVSRRTVQLALNHLRETSGEFAFHAEARLDTTCADRRGRCVRVALSSWLEHDQKPLLFDLQGKARGIRTSFRPDGEVLTPGPLTKATEPLTDKTEETKTEEAAEASPGPDSVSEPAPAEAATKCNFCLSHSVRLDEPAEFLPNPIPEAHLQIGHKPSPASPDLKGCDQNKLWRGSWGLARELRNDHFGDWDDCKLTYHRWRFELPLFVIRDIVAEAQQNGIAAPKIKNLFNSACFETNAAIFDGLAQNPGGLFRTVFRRRCQKGTGRFQSVVRQPESQKICKPIKSVGSVKTATDTAHDDAYRIELATKLRAFRLSMTSSHD